MKFDPQRLAPARATADELVQRGTYGSIVIAVGDARQTQWTHVVPGPDQATLKTVYRIASVTKPIVALAVMQLVEQGQILLNDPVVRFIPEFGQQGKDGVTVWHLLTHTSGLAVDDAQFRPLFHQRAPRDAYLALICASPVDFAPGTRSEYCNPAFPVLGELIRRVSGEDYPDYLRTRIFAPLDMTDTAFAPTDATRAAPLRGDETQADVDYFNSLAAPQGGLWSTAGDLLALGQTMLSGGRRGEYRLLHPITIETMTRLHTPGLMSHMNGPQPVYRALGWGKRGPTGVLLASEPSYGHGGATGALLWIDPLHDLVYVFLGNPMTDDPDIGRQRDAIRVMNTVYAALVT